MLRRFSRFLGIGAAGFLIDLGVFAAALNWTKVGPIASRCISFGVAVIFTWKINRTYTFADKASLRPSSELGRYFLSSLLAGFCNLGVYSALIFRFGAATPIPYLAMMAGVGAGFLVNFVLYDRVVFRRNQASV